MTPIEIDPATGAPIVKTEDTPTDIQPPATTSFEAASESVAPTTEEVKEDTKVSDAVHEIIPPPIIPTETKTLKDGITGKTVEVHIGPGIKVTNTKLQQIEAILRGGGMDSMQQIKSMQLIKEVLES